MACRGHVYIFFFNDTATTEIYTLSLHDALPIFGLVGYTSTKLHGTTRNPWNPALTPGGSSGGTAAAGSGGGGPRSEEDTSELQARQYLVCRLLAEKKKNMLCLDSHRSQHASLTV